MKKCIPNREGRSAAIMPTVLTSTVLAIAGSALPYFCANKTEIVARGIALPNNSSLLSSLLTSCSNCISKTWVLPESQHPSCFQRKGHTHGARSRRRSSYWGPGFDDNVEVVTELRSYIFRAVADDEMGQFSRPEGWCFDSLFRSLSQRMCHLLRPNPFINLLLCDEAELQSCLTQAETFPVRSQ
jgi:hypothetical protein